MKRTSKQWAWLICTKFQQACYPKRRQYVSSPRHCRLVPLWTRSLPDPYSFLVELIAAFMAKIPHQSLSLISTPPHLRRRYVLSYHLFVGVVENYLSGQSGNFETWVTKWSGHRTSTSRRGYAPSTSILREAWKLRTLHANNVRHLTTRFSHSTKSNYKSLCKWVTNFFCCINCQFSSFIGHPFPPPLPPPLPPPPPPQPI